MSTPRSQWRAVGSSVVIIDLDRATAVANKTTEDDETDDDETDDDEPKLCPNPFEG